MSDILIAKNIKKYFLFQPDWLSQFFKVKEGQPSYIKAVDNVSFTVRSGEILGIIGQSGSGKTTLAKTIIRLHEPTSGQALLMSKDIFTMSKSEVREQLRRKVRMIFQHPDMILNPSYTIRKILKQSMLEYSHNANTDYDSLIAALLQSVGLGQGYISKYPYELSGGEKRRVSICRALATHPKLIFADEPTSGLDVSLQHQILELILKIRDERGLSIVLISHDIGVVIGISDRVAVMYKGQMVELGPKKKVSPKRASHPYTRRLFQSHLTLDLKNQQKKFLKTTKSDNLELGASAGCQYVSSCSLWQEKGKPAICNDESPQLQPMGKEHFVACHFCGD